MRRLVSLAVALLVALPIAPAIAAPVAATTNPRATSAGASPDAAPSADTLSAADRWIVVLKKGSDVDEATTKAKGLGVKPDHAFKSAVHGYAATLTGPQVAELRADPSVAAVVPDAIVTLAGQSTPTGVERVSGPGSLVANVDGTDDRVDADVAILDTGIDPTHPDLNVAGGFNCATSDPAAWQDVHGHGTHVAGTVGALDNGFGVVGVAPGVRLWSVRTLDKDGNGLVSWYVCGLDWIAAQRDPADPTRPLFEAVNMSVERPGADDHACGTTNNDLIHQAICRVVAAGITVVAAAGNDSGNAAAHIPASYDEVITVSALADTDGQPGGLGGARCYSWGSYDQDDTFADFSNYGADVDLIAPGKCIWSTLPGNRYGYLSGTSMATPHVTGAVALYKASRPLASPSQVKAALQAAGTLDWNTATDPDAYHERLLDVAHIVAAGDFTVDAARPAQGVTGIGGVLSVPVTLYRAEDFAGAVDLTADAPAGVIATFGVPELTGLDGTSTALTVTVPAAMPSGRYTVLVHATGGARVRSVPVAITIDGDAPTLGTPTLAPVVGSRFETTWLTARATWPAATDATSGIAGYQAQWSVDGGAWSSAASLGAGTRLLQRTVAVGHRYALRVRARDAAGNWSAWSAPAAFTPAVTQDASRAVVRRGYWYRSWSSWWSGRSTLYSRSRGSSVTYVFTGRGIGLVLGTGLGRGKAQVYVDGSAVQTVDTYRSQFGPRRFVFVRTWTASARHTIRVVVLGTYRRPRVDVDAFVVIR